ncbi:MULTISPECIES: response regulator [Methylococcus]|jgi:DNA-binding response OmpR family regulator|uniref:DNA-binding response regulator n=1 Tax=Methylococcus capsulatus (strain ATCC 33009 / NCIMB 11132 / Bath) TaxID=243233 RepID=Q605F4_METCA|nr:response regulator transcription factor [Methylococcus capsulatus]AAU91534.1 DNA-binding response regulator [Methylococcus capsulatus str. Bath]
MRILLVEDDRKAAGLLTRGLGEEGFRVDTAHSAEDTEQKNLHTGYGLIILDWNLPGKDGLTFCEELRKREIRTPVLMLTARDALTDRVRGLDTGADDYLTKPFAFEELLARVRALLRRAEQARPAMLSVADLVLDPRSRRVTRSGRPLSLTPKEYAILELLLRRAGEVVSRTQLAEEIWRTGLIALDNLIDVHISNLRRKVDPPGVPPLIRTVRGCGFSLAAADSESP